MTYKIEVGLRNCLPPSKFNGETDAEFEARYNHWETQLKDKSFWRAMMIDGVDSDITRQHHMAIESPLFYNSANGSTELELTMSRCGIALRKRQESKKNDIANLAEVS